MLASLFACFLLLGLFIGTRALTNTPNIDKITFGYDLFSGNPLADRIDPGFKNQAIFALKYNEKKRSADGLWNVPDKITVTRSDSCRLNFDSTQISTTQSYQNTLDVDVTVSGGFLQVAKFKVSTQYQSMEKSLTTTNDEYYVSKAVCELYTASMNPTNPPELNPDFIQAVKSLPYDPYAPPYQDFLLKYGTHFVREITMGAKYGLISSISSTNAKNLKSQGITVTTAASASAFGVSGAVDSKMSSQKDWANKYTALRSSASVFSIGAKPVSGSDATAWSRQIISTPMPVRYVLEPIESLLTPAFFRGAIDANLLNRKQTVLQVNSRFLCDAYLVPSKKLKFGSC